MDPLKKALYPPTEGHAEFQLTRTLRFLANFKIMNCGERSCTPNRRAALPALFFLVLEKRSQSLELAVCQVAEGWHDGSWSVGLGILEVANQPGIGTTAIPFHGQVRTDGSTAAMQVVATEAAFTLRRLIIKGRQKAGVPGLTEVSPGDHVIVARVAANVEVVGSVERFGVAKVAGDLLAFFGFSLHAFGLAPIILGEIGMFTGGSGIGDQLAKFAARQGLGDQNVNGRTFEGQNAGLLRVGLRGLRLRAGPAVGD
jgi:hypothetical protein